MTFRNHSHQRGVHVSGTDAYSIGPPGRQAFYGSTPASHRDEQTVSRAGLDRFARRRRSPFVSARMIAPCHDSPLEFWQDRRPFCPKTYGPRLFGVLLEERSESRFVSHRLGSCDHMSAFTAKCPAERTGNQSHFERYFGQSRAPGAL
jgi:hypothetical protein